MRHAVLLWAGLGLVWLTAAPAAHATHGGPPDHPRDVYAEAPRPDQVVLSWSTGSPPAGGEPAAERYQVLRDGVAIAETAQRRHVDSWLVEGTRYTYAVRALDEHGGVADSGPVGITTPAFGAGLELAPYLQQLSPARAVIVWQTYAPATTSLHFGPAGGPLANVARDSQLRRDHVVAVDGLVPGTAYSYRWESDGRIGEPGELRTPPATMSSFRFGVIGDFGVPTPAARANLRRLVLDPVDLAITTGDNAQIHGNEEEYRNYVLGPLGEFVAKRPLWPSVGNHDYYGLDSYRRYFALPGNERYYSFSYGGVLFLALDSNRYNRRQKSWARRTLRSSGATCKVAYFHHPLWSSGRGYRNGVRNRRRQKIARILERGGVDLVLNGHLQHYERSKPLWRGRVNRRRGVTYVVTGGGGARLTPFATRRRPKWSARRGIFYHRMSFTAASHRLRGKAIDTAGRARDRFSVRCR
jgi:3',5'-cyclic AMP phosphodiesterase CpdA